MPRVNFIEHTGVEHHVEGEIGKSLMQIAVENAVPGILADCGGGASCGTCHAYLGAEWMARASRPAEIETSILEGLLDTRETSRLTCQITMTDELDQIVVHLPASQL